ncbi:MAG: HisA/HisF-related TIM barrel protein [Thermoplasmata archaeon]|nr:HisA/HisF-related TIM barrel protein [Thermoplasmata archaeon]MCI4337391.1 HisA/HisF-related TIM barrel protein [Thermoplasmata archaeon]
MSAPPAKRSTTGPRRRAAITLSHGKLVVATETGYASVRGPDGKFREILDVADALAPEYDGLYVVDLDGRRKGEPQLDYIQELSRDADLWLDAGVQRADEAIDGLVAGARRVVLSTASLASARELRRAWKMSQEIVAELVVSPEGTVVALEGEWVGRSPLEVAEAIRAVGVTTILYSPRALATDWSLLTQLARTGPTWVSGIPTGPLSSGLAGSGAEGAVVQIPGEILSELPAPTPSADPRA